MDLKEFQGSIDKVMEHVINDLAQIHTGRATPELIEDIKLNAYGGQSVMKAVGTVSVSDSRSLVIQPWDKSLLESIVKGVSASNLGFSASIEGEYVRVKIPELTEERRKDFVKVMKEKIEAGRVSVRNVRQDFMKAVDSMMSSGLSEDDGKRLKAEGEKIVKTSNEKIEELREKKESELMNI